MNDRLAADIAGVRQAHRRLAETMVDVTDDVARRPSRLPGWTVGHVLTHLARNADSVVRRLEGAVRDEVVDQYEGGYEGRAAEIEGGAGRAAVDLVADVLASAAAVDAACDAMPEEAWPRYTRSVGGALLPAERLPFSRWREVEVHHVDLGLGYGCRDWSDGFVAEELPRALATVAGRLRDDAGRRQLLGWLLDRAPAPEAGALGLDPWG
ncbi:MAG TPA: maleylpyruvate isomerase N-terminal domain-containing protein [Acidimicrobiales bacterium]|jgi:maleylpyruvate isomerase|nr:maleylpyruvate isomerase N-terminal domain-containing protein [Acidimicrobiales bacterium]